MANSSAPIVIVYDNDVTYNQATTQMSDSGMYDKLTFELLMDETKQNQLKVETNRPNGPVDRLLSDVLGLIVLYATTFLFCDLYRTWKTGRWTSLVWMFLGPWNALTGAPLLHKLTKLFDHVDEKSRAVNRCDSKYQSAKNLCGAKNAPILFGSSNEEYDECMSDASNAHTACIESTPDFKECMDNAESKNQYCLTYTDGTVTCVPMYSQNELEIQCINTVSSM